ncbi:glycosyltransferase family 2 protein [Paenibacillus xylanexedens]|uniref:glycosyltransferase family 2 protein n=1 Tax=Paenibacillus xylanexedens TaxID=528191 RepID=UPI001C8DE270|nr:glycosyltransferase family 2 protein [Paenibacillus xylanexedens]MBY0118889.1 glycosyltransferase family 2 protein [Paenibacillus xylanexedens]
MKVSIVIPNYNGDSYLKDCLCSLKNQTYTDYEVILVDNNSTDGSISLAHSILPSITIIKMSSNVGFSKAVNAGIMNSQGEYVVLLNNDTIAYANWLFNLVNCIEQDSLIFSCSSKMLSYHNPCLVDDAGDAYTIFGIAYQEGHGKNKHLFDKDRDVFSACAGAAIYRRSLFDKIGYFDERFFAYLEDVDIGYRARLYGFRNVLCSSAEIMHIGSATTGGGYSPLKVKLSARNNVFLIYKNMLCIQMALNLPFIMLGLIMKYLVYKKIGLSKDYIEGLLEGVRYIKNERVEKSGYKIMHIISVQYWLVKKGVYILWNKMQRVLR